MSGDKSGWRKGVTEAEGMCEVNLALLTLTDIHVPFVSSLGPISQPAVGQLTGFSTVSSKTEKKQCIEKNGQI